MHRTLMLSILAVQGLTKDAVAQVGSGACVYAAAPTTSTVTPNTSQDLRCYHVSANATIGLVVSFGRERIACSHSNRVCACA